MSNEAESQENEVLTKGAFAGVSIEFAAHIQAARLKAGNSTADKLANLSEALQRWLDDGRQLTMLDQSFYETEVFNAASDNPASSAEATFRHLSIAVGLRGAEVAEKANQLAAEQLAEAELARTTNEAIAASNEAMATANRAMAETNKELAESTEGLVTQTKKLAWATVAMAVMTALMALATVALAVGTFLDDGSVPEDAPVVEQTEPE